VSNRRRLGNAAQSVLVIGPVSADSSALAIDPRRCDRNRREVMIVPFANRITVGPRVSEVPPWIYFPPVVAMPLTKNRWPNKNTRNSGIKVTTDMANMAPQLLPAVASRNERSATGTV
jgi:hypothetical protein